jgi:DNA-binding transcriptional LysR family regulator
LLLTETLGEISRCERSLVISVCRADDADDVLRLVREGVAEIGFSDLTTLACDRQLTALPIAELEVVLVSPMGTDLPAAVSWNDVVTQPLIVPPPHSGRRERINEMAKKASAATPRATVVLEDRGSWIAAAQAGMGSFLSYRRVVAGYERIEIRPFTPHNVVTVGFVHQDLELSTTAARFIDLARSKTWPPAPTAVDRVMRPLKDELDELESFGVGAR